MRNQISLTNFMEELAIKVEQIIQEIKSGT